jgi:TonB family protein
MKMASSIRAEIEAEEAREQAEAPVILVQPDARPLVSVQRTERVLTLPFPLGAHDTPPVWTRRPEPTYPREALGAGIEVGEVDLRCVARATGQIAFCAIASETPEGYGFGREAVRATKAARIQPAEIDGEQVDSSIHFSVRFRLQ